MSNKPNALAEREADALSAKGFLQNSRNRHRTPILERPFFAAAAGQRAMFHGRNRLSESLPKEIVDQLEKLRQVERKLLKREPIECLGEIARLATSNPRHRRGS